MLLWNSSGRNEQNLLHIFCAAFHIRLLCPVCSTGAIMENLAKDLLGVKMCSFLPKHNRNLSNEFRCFVNYPSLLLNCWGAEPQGGCHTDTTAVVFTVEDRDDTFRPAVTVEIIHFISFHYKWTWAHDSLLKKTFLQKQLLTMGISI